MHEVREGGGSAGGRVGGGVEKKGEGMDIQVRMRRADRLKQAGHRASCSGRGAQVTCWGDPL